MPTLHVEHSIANWNILLGQMGLSALLDSSISGSSGSADENNDEDEDPYSFAVQSFAGIEGFPLGSVTQLQHKTVLEIGFEEEDEGSTVAPVSADIIGAGKPVQPRPKTRRPQPKKMVTRNAVSSGDNVQFVRVARRAQPSSSSTTIVESSVMKVLDAGSRGDLHRKEHLMASAQSSMPLSVNFSKQQRRLHVNLAEEEFAYLVLDNISGLVLAMGKYRPRV